MRLTMPRSTKWGADRDFILGFLLGEGPPAGEMKKACSHPWALEANQSKLPRAQFILSMSLTIP